MMRKIKLMADYDCFPLWEASKDKLENIDPNSLKISGDLKESLYRWGKAYDTTLNQDYPPDSGFTTETLQCQVLIKIKPRKSPDHDDVPSSIRRK